MVFWGPLDSLFAGSWPSLRLGSRSFGRGRLRLLALGASEAGKQGLTRAGPWALKGPLMHTYIYIYIYVYIYIFRERDR